MDRGPRDGTSSTAEPLRPAITCNPDGVPAPLRERRQWIVWRYGVRKGEITKLPTDFRSGQEIDATDPSNWSTFAEVVHALGGGSAFAGIGFVFTPDDPYCGIDLDDCLNDDGTLVDSAQQIVDTFNSYTEISPSGEGVKIIIEGTKAPWAKARLCAGTFWMLIRGFLTAAGALAGKSLERIDKHSILVILVWHEY
ncbi:hypothetical protein ACERK3_07100 [Phycisphaerales bacterium AB-hyl4]|uniref:Uncharacterized protein n=1 Tax=Natronomicrosphaera hydrolytica TaxID=3242702 RepID=A0ABV4U5D5_9BACT